MTPLDDTEKLRLVGEFRAFLDQWEDGADDAELLDLRSLLAEMAALRSEVRLESRQFKGALEELKSFGEALRAHNERLARTFQVPHEPLVVRAQRLAEALQLFQRTLEPVSYTHLTLPTTILV